MFSTGDDRMLYVAISIMVVISLIVLATIMYSHKDDKDIKDNPNVIVLNGSKYIKIEKYEEKEIK